MTAVSRFFWVQLDPDWVIEGSKMLRGHRVPNAARALKEWLEAAVPGNKLVLHTEKTEDSKPSFFVPAGTHFLRRTWASMHKLVLDLLRATDVHCSPSQVREILAQAALLGTLAWEEPVPHPADRDQGVFVQFEGGAAGTTTWPITLQPGVVVVNGLEQWAPVGVPPVVDEPDGDPSACPEFRQWLVDRWPDHHEKVLGIMAECRVLGLLGLGGASEKAVNFMGPTSGGKSTALNIITHSHDGAHTTARVTPHTVSDPVHRYEIMTARWAVVDDDDYDWEGIKDFKALLSPYPVLQRTLYERPEKIGNKSLLLMASNQPPPFGAAACEDATYRRFILVPPPTQVPEAQRIRGWEQVLLKKEGPAIRRLFWELGWPTVKAWIEGKGKLFQTAPYDLVETRHLWLLDSAPYYRDIVNRKFVYTGDVGDVLRCGPLIAELGDRAFDRDPVVRGRLGNLGYLLRALAREPRATCSFPDTVVGVKRRT